MSFNSSQTISILGDFMVKSKALIILLVLVMLIANFSVCFGDDPTTPVSIYNSTDGNPIYNPPLGNPEDTISIYNSTGGSPNNPPPGEIVELAELIEYTKVPIDAAYSRDRLQNINVSDNILEAFSRFGLWLETQNVDAEAEDINIMYIDDDLRVIENYWIFATRPEAKEMYIEVIQNSMSENPSPDEMIVFLQNFNEQYPVKYVRTGLALFVTIENKEVLLSEISEEDIQMLEAIKNAILEEQYMNLGWGSSSPNVHADMSEWAAQKTGFNTADVTNISMNAAEPDNVSYLDLANSYIISYDSVEYIISGIIISAAEFFQLKNYNHYYNPVYYNPSSGSGFGGAPDCIENEYNSISTSGSHDEKIKKLSYSSHYMADLSMPLHVNYAAQQTILYLPYFLNFEQPHFSYENDYVGANWTINHNFSQYAKNVNQGYYIYDAKSQSKDLAYYAYLYSDDAWICGNMLTLLGNIYSPSSSVFYATAFSIDEGQRYLIGLMHNGYQQIYQGFTNQQDITLQLEKNEFRVQELDLTNLRVSMGAGDSAYIYLNGNVILKFVDSSLGGNLTIYNENGNQLGVISTVNGKPTYENMTFDVSFVHDGSEMVINIQKYHNGVFNSISSYSYMTNNDISTLRAYIIGYQSNVDYISSQYMVHYEPLSENLSGFFVNQEDITLQLEKAGGRVQRVDLTNLRVSMGAGDVAYIHLNGNEILKFVDSSAGGNLYIYNENGNPLGTISQVNGKSAFENMTFDVSFIHDGSVMNIEIKKYHNGVLNSTSNYSYMTNNDISTLRAYMVGYQFNVDFISSQYKAYHEPLLVTSLNGSFVNQQDTTLPLGMAGFRVQEVDLTNLRVSMGAGDIAYIHLNGQEILKFVDSSAGGNLYIYNEYGTQLGVISKVNGKQNYENMTFDVSFIHDGSVMNIEIQKYHNGVFNSTSSYSYMTNNDMSTLRAYMTGYQSNVDYISSQYTIYYEP